MVLSRRSKAKHVMVSSCCFAISDIRNGGRVNCVATFLEYDCLQKVYREIP